MPTKKKPATKKPSKKQPTTSKKKASKKAPSKKKAAPSKKKAAPAKKASKKKAAPAKKAAKKAPKKAAPSTTSTTSTGSSSTAAIAHALEALKAKAVAALKKTKFVKTTADDVIAALDPMIGFELGPVKGTPRSFVGGRPLAPQGFTWPEGDEGPYAFLAQVCFEDCKGFDFSGRLPDKGIAYFFAAYDEDAVSNDDDLPGAVVYVDDAKDLVEIEEPAFSDPVEARLHKRAMTFRLGHKTDLDLLVEVDDNTAFEKTMKPLRGDWDGYLLGGLLFPKFTLDASTQTNLLHLAAFTLWRQLDVDKKKGHPSSMYAASCFDFVIPHAALQKRQLASTELWFDFFS